MKSQIIVDMDFESGQPVIRFKVDQESEVLADKTLRYFIEKATTKEGAVLYFTYKDWPQVQQGSDMELRCEVIAAATEEGGDELDFIAEAKARALTYCTDEKEKKRIAAVFDGWDAKASIRLLNENPEEYKRRHTVK